MSDSFNHDLIALLPNLRRFALSLCRSQSLADDLVQAACEKALKSRDTFQAGSNFEAWLFRILRNAWIDHIRRTKTQGAEVDIHSAPDLAAVAGDTPAEDRLTLKKALEVIESLPEQQREVVYLVCVEELSYKDAATILNVPIGTVMSRLARARTKLSQTLGIN